MIFRIAETLFVGVFGTSKQQAISFFTVSFAIVWGKYFLKKINLVDSNILLQNDLAITKHSFVGSKKLIDDKNNGLLRSTIEFI